MILGGQSLYVLEMRARRLRARWPRTRPRRPRTINVLEVRSFGSMGRVYLGGEEADIDVGWQAAVAAIEGIDGRDAKA